MTLQTFQTFQTHRAHLLRTFPHAFDGAETRLAQALAPYRPRLDNATRPARAHRCHLAEFWLDAMGLPRALKPQTLVCQGVRQALAVLMAGFAAAGRTMWLPDDVYPVYRTLAQDAGLCTRGYRAAQPESLIAALSDPDQTSTPDLVLITLPIKPWGRWLTSVEWATLQRWLRADARRRVIVDAVYTWTDEFDPSILALWATGQAIVLHSLSKGWAFPLVMGVALVPEIDVSRWTPAFRQLTLAPADLQTAHVLLTQHPRFPSTLIPLLAAAETRLRTRLDQMGITLAPPTALDPPRYHLVVPHDASALWRDHGLVALPACVFGGPDEAISVVTTLSTLTSPA